MEAVLWIIGAGGWAKANMVTALGSLITRKRDNAFRVGATIHLCAAIVFAVLYAAIMVRLGFTRLPAAMMLGGGIGFVHGLIVSLGLVWVVAEQHPLEEYTDAGLAIGLSHLVGHVAYGLVVGFVVALVVG
jgi:hypothetical protein